MTNKYTPETRVQLRRLAEIRREKAELRDREARFREDNLIYFFNLPREQGGMPANPKQAELLLGWGEPLRVVAAEAAMTTKEMLDLERSQRAGYKVFTMTGGNRLGKTTLSTILGLTTVFGEWPWTCDDNRPGTGEKVEWITHKMPRKVRYIGQDWEKHIAQVVIPEIKKWWPANRPVRIKKNSLGIEALWIDEMTGSSLEIMSNKQESELHEGWPGDLILYDEPPKRDIRVANARGLVDRLGREFFGMTLLKEPWVDREVIRALEEDGTPDLSVFNVHGEIWDNEGYGISAEGIAQFSKTLRPEEREARLKGIPSYMSGLVLPEFNRNKHVRPVAKKVPLDWVLDIMIDFHPSKPWAVLFKATDKRGFHYVIDEIWESGSWKAIGEEIVRRIKRLGLRVNVIGIDPLAKGDKNSDLQEESVFDKMADLFAAYDYSLHVASKDKEGGIHILRDLLETENEMTALFIWNKCKRTVYEAEGWMYDDQGRPQKKDDDMMECLYRLCLLNTEWVPLDDEDDYEKPIEAGNIHTGY